MRFNRKFFFICFVILNWNSIFCSDEKNEKTKHELGISIFLYKTEKRIDSGLAGRFFSDLMNLFDKSRHKKSGMCVDWYMKNYVFCPYRSFKFAAPEKNDLCFFVSNIYPHEEETDGNPIASG